LWLRVVVVVEHSPVVVAGREDSVLEQDLVLLRELRIPSPLEEAALPKQ
jgi:hypothetical protein